MARVLVPIRRHEMRAPVGRVEQSGLDGRWLAPRRRFALGSPHANPDDDALARGERRERPRYEHRLVRHDLPGSATWLAVAPFGLDLVGGLAPTAGAGFNRPGKSRPSASDAEWLAQMLEAKVGDFEIVRRAGLTKGHRASFRLSS